MCYNPDAQLAAVLQPYSVLEADGCQAKAAECDRLRFEIERLTMVCPSHEPTLMTNAVIAHERREPEKAQQFLDRILSVPASHPDAAALRAEIAVEEGNLPFARRLLTDQIALAPSHAGLRETLGATLYFTGNFGDARRELDAAARLGAPVWRVAYHLGLVEEAEGNLEAARQRYTEAAAARPDWAPPRTRLNALANGVAVPRPR
jgi:tetratricopeptide (TPR) repeat protein